MLAQARAGVRHLIGDRVLGNVLVGVGICLLVLGFTEASIFALLDAVDRPATYAGVFVTIQGIGALTGGLVASRLIRRTGEVGACALGLGVLAVSMLGIAAAPNLAVMLVFAAVMGLSLAPLMISFNTLIQRRTPQALMGRVSTAVEVVMSVPSAVSLALGALLVSLVDWRVIFLVIGVVVAVGAGYIVTRLRDVIAADWRRPPPQRSVDERLDVVGEDLLREGRGAGDAHALHQVVGDDAAALGALGAHRDLATRDNGRQ